MKGYWIGCRTALHNFVQLRGKSGYATGKTHCYVVAQPYKYGWNVRWDCVTVDNAINLATLPNRTVKCGIFSGYATNYVTMTWLQEEEKRNLGRNIKKLWSWNDYRIALSKIDTSKVPQPTFSPPVTAEPRVQYQVVRSKVKWFRIGCRTGLRSVG